MVIAWDFGGLRECVRRYFGLSIVVLGLFSEGHHLDTGTADFDQCGPQAGVLSTWDFYTQTVGSP